MFLPFGPFAVFDIVRRHQKQTIMEVAGYFAPSGDLTPGIKDVAYYILDAHKRCQPKLIAKLGGFAVRETAEYWSALVDITGKLFVAFAQQFQQGDPMASITFTEVALNSRMQRRAASMEFVVK